MSITVKIYLVNCAIIVKVYLYFYLFLSRYILSRCLYCFIYLIDKIKGIMTIDLTTDGNKLWIEVDRVID